ncbi:MAG: ArsB/NhaD family transporter [Methylacidiphilales bacterium]|nr:ArsB/NhaD family transporter [Candidatus Methylacidiphilales bacterium]
MHGGSGTLVPQVIFGLDPLWVSTAVLATTYALIISEKVNRSIVALLGAGLMIVVGILDQAEAVRGIDFNTIGLLTGMMILVSISRRSGMFQYVAVWAAKKAHASPWGILLLLQLVTAVLSALLDNVTTVLLIVPVTLAVTRELRVPAYPFLFAEIFASNIGGTATLIGDPPNILIGSLVGLDFNAFIYHLAPVAAVVLTMQVAMIHLMWGRSLAAAPADRAHVMAMREIDTIEDWTLLKQSLGVLALTILGFVSARFIHMEPASIALGGAAMLMLLDNWRHHGERAATNIHKTFSDVEWITIFFFLGLFVVVHGVEVGGLLGLLGRELVTLTGGDLALTGYAILWASAVLSAIIDNIPFVATMIPLVKTMAPAFGGSEHIEPLWWCLSLGACLGGNGTLIGASANLTVAGIGERNGVPFRFVTFSLYAFPMMLGSIAIAHLYVWLRYF